MRHLRTARAAALVALLGLTAVACGGDDTGSADSASATTVAAGASTTAANASTLPTIAKPWARATADSAKTGAAYFTVTAATDDKLVSAKVPTSVAGMTEIHEVTMANGAMSMKELAGGLPLPAGTAVELKPGGYHIMLMQLAAPLKSGTSFDLTLTFEKAGTTTISVPVRDTAP